LLSFLKLFQLSVSVVLQKGVQFLSANLSPKTEERWLLS
jgi:hypothetical protein